MIVRRTTLSPATESVVISVRAKPRSSVSALEPEAAGTWIARLRTSPVDGKANAELKQLATKKGVMLPDAVSEEQKKMLEHLTSLKGREFDTAFKQHAVENHQKSVDKFKTAAEKAKDADLKAFAAKTPSARATVPAAR